MATLFWMIVILVVVFCFWWPNNPARVNAYPFVGNLPILVLICLLGWKVFGSVIKG